MTDKYSPTVNPGDTRQRVWRATTENPCSEPRSKIFHEQEVVRTHDGREVPTGVTRVFTVSCDSIEMSDVVQLRNPDTDEVIGTATVMDALILEYSFARYAQYRQDALDAQES